MRDAAVPGTCRRPEEVAALVVASPDPDPRIVEALPAVLAWNEWHPVLLEAHGRVAGTRALRRLAWLAEIALTIDRAGGFPGGLDRSRLASFIESVFRDKRPTDWDDLSRPQAPPLPPLWKRWRINYGATLADFEERARRLLSLREQSAGRGKMTR